MKTTNFLKAAFAFSLFILFNLFTSCHPSFESRIKEKIAADLKTHYKVILSLKELTDFDWDRLYVFDAHCSLKEINKVLGFDYPFYKEFSRILVFIKDEKIVYHEENAHSIEGIEDGEVIFSSNDTLKYSSYRKGAAFFRVENKKFEKGTYYELIQLK